MKRLALLSFVVALFLLCDSGFARRRRRMGGGALTIAKAWLNVKAQAIALLDAVNDRFLYHNKRHGELFAAQLSAAFLRNYAKLKEAVYGTKDEKGIRALIGTSNFVAEVADSTDELFAKVELTPELGEAIGYCHDLGYAYDLVEKLVEDQDKVAEVAERSLDPKEKLDTVSKDHEIRSLKIFLDLAAKQLLALSEDDKPVFKLQMLFGATVISLTLADKQPENTILKAIAAAEDRIAAAEDRIVVAEDRRGFAFMKEELAAYKTGVPANDANSLKATVAASLAMLGDFSHLLLPADFQDGGLRLFKETEKWGGSSEFGPNRGIVTHKRRLCRYYQFLFCSQPGFVAFIRPQVVKRASLLIGTSEPDWSWTAEKAFQETFEEIKDAETDPETDASSVFAGCGWSEEEPACPKK